MGIGIEPPPAATPPAVYAAAPLTPFPVGPNG